MSSSRMIEVKHDAPENGWRQIQDLQRPFLGFAASPLSIRAPHLTRYNYIFYHKRLLRLYATAQSTLERPEVIKGG